MKPEPLDGKEKVITYRGYLRTKDGAKYPISLITKGFLKSDVKSAVRWLLKEIERYDKSFTFEDKQIIIDLVEKAFKDVLEEVKEE